MPDQRTHERGTRATARAGGNELQISPSSSRMLANYLADIEQLLDEQQWEAALHEAVDLPQLAVALGDPQLSTSNERLEDWCHKWIRPEDPDRNAKGSEYERVSGIVIERAVRDEAVASDTVPSIALRRLRLRRLVRTPHRGFSSGRSGALAPEGTDGAGICTILVEAARRWYAQSACHDATVQANLARLAVLR
jgi:hypothetical protein